MKKKKPLKRFFGLFDPVGTKKYVTQITLILVSLLIATSVDRCREASKNKEKLREYLDAVLIDVQEESKICQMNLNDCQKDLKSLAQTLRLARMSQDDSLALALKYYSQVYWRGVFRAFPPTTFEMMGETGDASLLKDLPLRNKLSGIFAFRRTVVQDDLKRYDQQVETCTAALGQYLDLASLLYSDQFDPRCITDRSGFLKSPHNEIFLLIRVANLRAFHLKNALEDLTAAETDLTAFLTQL